MGPGSQTVDIDPASGGILLAAADGRTARLHPLWLRERTTDPEAIDPVNHQRLFEPCELARDLHVTAARIASPGELSVAFSDGAHCRVSLTAVAVELGWRADPEAPPAPEPWDASLDERPEARWDELGEPRVMRCLLEGFSRRGFCVLKETPTVPGTLASIARRFGFVRDTNFGPIFDVFTKPKPIDMAYTGRKLSAHADNPYRRPIPGIQILHCLENSVEGGLSTLVDGFALSRQIAAEAPDLARVLETTAVRFRFESEVAIMEARGPLIERDLEGNLKCVRFSSRVDYVPPLDPAILDCFYEGRRLLYALAHDPAFQIRNAFEPGMVLMMDNHRLLHGRTDFDHTAGRRHLQGCYIDHDGPESLYRVLTRGGTATEVGREVA